MHQVRIAEKIFSVEFGPCELYTKCTLQSGKYGSWSTTKAAGTSWQPCKVGQRSHRTTYVGTYTCNIREGASMQTSFENRE